ncbi:MAG TPA: Tol-Pal system beta propeller repeat protein TolB [Thioalkalivibrio sp.]|nr:Tol-Pal system beta propeller repeat protein TolB [Thioalkalivibrio sp.]
MKKLAFVLLIGLLAMAGSAQAKLEIRITQGVESALPIAIVPFGFQGKTQAAPENISAIVEADLARSGQFKPLAATVFAQRPTHGQEIDFARWRKQGIDHVVVGRVTETADGRYTVQFQLFNVLQGRQLTGYSIPARQQDLRRAAHQISDYVYETLIGERGAFNTRVAYVTTQDSGGKREFLLQVADADGFNPRVIRRSSRPLMSPAWSPDGRRIAYVSFEGNRSAIYVQDVATGEREKVSDRPGINGAPAWSPDGRQLALALSETGDPEIHVLDLASRRLTRLTFDRGIDTEPSWTPDGQHIVFTSDRSGGPQLYQVSVRGGRATRLSFDGSYNAAPEVSPAGDKVVMVRGQGNQFRIAVQDLKTRYSRILTRGRLDESPSFAPNGRMIIYATREGNRGVLAAVSEDGNVHQLLVLEEGEVREPAWSPFYQ